MKIPNQQHFDRVLMPVAIQQNLSISDNQAGILLGHEIEMESGAMIHIGDFIDENNKRLVTIQGTQQQVNQALQIIRRILLINDDDKTLFF